MGRNTNLRSYLDNYWYCHSLKCENVVDMLWKEYSEFSFKQVEMLASNLLVGSWKCKSGAQK